MPLPINEWTHPARQVTITETSETTIYRIEIYMDGSKDGSMVGAGAVIYSNKQLVKQCKYKLRSYCSNNQAEQIAILKELELQKMETPKGGMAAIYTDSKVAIDSLKNHVMHGFLIEKIRNKIRHLSMQNWTIHIRWVKAHSGIKGNETADKLAKAAAQDDENQNIVFDRIPITSVASEIKRKVLERWKRQWSNTEKGAGCRSFFPRLEQRLKMKMPITPEFTALVTSHGKTKSYLHRFKLADDSMCPCNEGQQTSEHIIFKCNIFEAQRSSLIKQIMISEGSWSPANDKLITKYLKAFSSSVQSNDIKKLN
jgi:ribonuclease HI